MSKNNFSWCLCDYHPAIYILQVLVKLVPTTLIIFIMYLFNPGFALSVTEMKMYDQHVKRVSAKHGIHQNHKNINRVVFVMSSS